MALAEKQDTDLYCQLVGVGSCLASPIRTMVAPVSAHAFVIRAIGSVAIIWASSTNSTDLALDLVQEVGGPVLRPVNLGSRSATARRSNAAFS